MNQRFIDLYREAIKDNSIGESIESANWFVCTHDQLEAFGKLIVEECARIAATTPCPYEDQFALNTYGHTWDMACAESANNIRTEFLTDKILITKQNPTVTSNQYNKGCSACGLGSNYGYVCYRSDCPDRFHVKS